ncbi:hypothetical protein [Cesiribacter sp. SM1]|uniref:hypothetical protein n=1 Tax=Cesiribacter sp. SM1 TaxID=2861196 RepID=UPI001CD63597|nr:hypothetical protein [Cesiribacter sp. SM1]
MILKSIKSGLLIVFLTIAISCQMDEISFQNGNSGPAYFTGIIGGETEIWNLPEYNYQQGLVDHSAFNDSVRYSFQVFNNINRISLITKDIREIDFDNFFRIGDYRIDEDYHLVLTMDKNSYRSKKSEFDNIKLIEIRTLPKNKLIAYTPLSVIFMMIMEDLRIK